MLARLTHAAIAFAVTAGSYQAYVQTVAPWFDPPTATIAAPAPTGEEPLAPGLSLQPHRELLAAYFPADHWSLADDVILLENDHALVVLKRYEQTSSGQLTVPQCAVVVFPQSRSSGSPPPRDAIILEPAGGAVLQMDQPAGGMSMGRLQFGQLLGETIVRSDMHEPGPQDDLLIATHNLYMNEDLIRTSEPVQLQLGPHYARGRELEIHFLPVEPQVDGGPQAWYGALEWLEISDEVNVSIALEEGTWGGAASTEKSAAATPLRIRSGGPLRVDFANYLASFQSAGASAYREQSASGAGKAPRTPPPTGDVAGRVVVRQLHPDGRLDELQADQLDLFFRPRTAGATPDADAADSARPWQSFLPASVEARGSSQSPVTLDAASHQARVRCEHMWIDLHSRMVTVEGGDEVMLSYQGAEIHAPMVQYKLPPAGSTQVVGELAARGGGGRLRAVLDPRRPDQVLEVDWKEKLEIRRVDDRPVLTLDGRPRVWMSGFGELYADALEIFLRERPPTAGLATSSASSWPAAVVPQRLSASGRVTLDSAELSCRVNQFDVRLAYPAVSPAGGGVGPGVAATPAAGTTATTASTPLAAGLGGPRRGPRKTYRAAAVSLRVAAELRQGQPVLTAVRLDGAVELEEQSAELTGDPPLRVRAERVDLAGANTAQERLEVAGGGAASPAEILVQGGVLRAPLLSIERGAGRAAVNSPGDLELRIERDLTGQPLAAPQQLQIRWERQMELVDRRISFLGQVVARHDDGLLRTERLVVQTTAPLATLRPAGTTPQLEQLECWDGVVADYQQRDDAGGATSRQHLELQSLLANQLTGELRGDGPGTIDSVHLGGGGVPGPLGAAADQGGLRRLRIEFVRGVTGNLRERRVTVAGDVRTAYGPVADWDQPLPTALGGPAPGVFWISCDEQTVVESPLVQLQPRRAGLGPVELVAAGRVRIEGADPKQGEFVLTGGRATYDQAKSVFALHGDNVRPATVARRKSAAQPPSEDSADKLIYNHATGDVRIEGVHRFQWENFDDAPQ